MASTFERVRDVVVHQLKVPAAEVTPEANFVEDLRADSLDIVDLTIAIEEAFQSDAEFEIRDEDAENIHTVQDILDFLARQGIS